MVANNRYLGHAMPRAFINKVDNIFAILGGLGLRIDFYTEIAFRLKVRNQILPPFLKNFRIKPSLLIKRKQFFPSPTPQMCTLDLHVSNLPRRNLEMHIRQIS